MDGLFGNITSDVQTLVPHASRRVQNIACIWIVEESCHNWIWDLLNLCIGDIRWMLWLCGLVYIYIGGFCWWLWIIDYALIAWPTCLCLYTWWIYLMIIILVIVMRWELHIYSDSLIMMFACLQLWNEELYLLS